MAASFGSTGTSSPSFQSINATTSTGSNNSEQIMLLQPQSPLVSAVASMPVPNRIIQISFQQNNQQAPPTTTTPHTKRTSFSAALMAAAEPTYENITQLASSSPRSSTSSSAASTAANQAVVVAAHQSTVRFSPQLSVIRRNSTPVLSPLVAQPSTEVASTELDNLRQTIEQFISSNSEMQQTQLAQAMTGMLQKAWDNSLGMSEQLCRAVRVDGALALALSLLGTSDSRNLQVALLRFSTAAMSTENRQWVVESNSVTNEKCSDASLSLLLENQALTHPTIDVELASEAYLFIQSLLGLGSEACTTVLDNGLIQPLFDGLRALLSTVSSPDCPINPVVGLKVQATMSTCLATIAICLEDSNYAQLFFEAVESSRLAIKDLLLPLCCSQNDVETQYLGLVAATAFCCLDSKIALVIRESGISKLIADFLGNPRAIQSPAMFPSFLSAPGFSAVAISPKRWLGKFFKLIDSTDIGRAGFEPRLQAMAIFHVAVELSKLPGLQRIELKPICSNLFIRIIQSSPNQLASKLVQGILEQLEISMSTKLTSNVPQWTSIEVLQFFQGYLGRSSDLDLIDGDLLLSADVEALSRRLAGGSDDVLRRAYFERLLMQVKQVADYSAVDSTKLAEQLEAVDMKQYTYALIKAGVDKLGLSEVTDEQLSKDCNILNAIHRQIILSTVNVVRRFDFFICYKRSTGCTFASLLKVHLAQRGFRVFLDVASLSSGNCHGRLEQAVSSSRAIVVVLTSKTLDGCIGDVNCTDWVHKEISWALNAPSSPLIIPVVDSTSATFTWPTDLPNDIQPIVGLNAVQWSHEYQDASVDKIVTWFQQAAKVVAVARPTQVNASDSSSQNRDAAAAQCSNRVTLRSSTANTPHGQTTFSATPRL